MNKSFPGIFFQQAFSWSLATFCSGEATKIIIQEPKADTKGKAIVGAPAPIIVATKAAQHQRKGWKKGLAVFRLGSQAGFAAATSITGTADQTLPFFTQLFHFHVEFNDLPTFLPFLPAAFRILSLKALTSAIMIK